MILSVLCTYKILKPRLECCRMLDEETAQENEALQQKHAELQSSYQILREKKEELSVAVFELQDIFNGLQQQADNSAQIAYDQSMKLMQEKLGQSAERERQKYLQAIESYKKELAVIMQEGAEAYINSIAETSEEYEKLKEKFENLLDTTNNAIAAAKRAEEIKQEANFYKIQLSDIDKDEIRMLRNVAPYLRDKEPLNKVIWKVYYEKPTTDLIGRIVGLNVKTGIYKITNLENQMCYVGQAVNIADRWKQHIKRGLGAEAPTKNKLYPAMITFGV